MLLTQTSEGGQRVPPVASLIEAFTYFFFYQTHSHNINLKLTRLELTIERSYLTHSNTYFLR